MNKSEIINLPRVTIPSKKNHRQSRPLRVAEAIKNWVVEQGLRIGDRLPSEPKMIEHFKMSKSTIREAMRLLEAQGLVKSKTGPGGGCFVHAVSQERATALLANYFYFRNLTIGDIYQLRRILEPELAAALAGKLSEEQLNQLEETIAKYSSPASSLEEEQQHHINSLKFHALLASYAKNELLGFLIGFMVNMLSDLTIYRRLYSPPNIELWEKGYHYQNELVGALRTAQPEDARQVMANHMKTAQKLMEDQEAELLRGFIAE